MKTKFTTGRKIINIDKEKKKRFKNHVIDLSKKHVESYYDRFLAVNRVR